jgi:hypothetical protein
LQIKAEGRFAFLPDRLLTDRSLLLTMRIPRVGLVELVGGVMIVYGFFIAYAIFVRPELLLGQPSETSPVDPSCVFFFGILSAPKNRFWRQFMRDTWIRALPSKCCYKFFLGRDLSASLLSEQKRTLDLVFLPIEEGYDLLSLKTDAIADWVSSDAADRHLHHVISV